MARDRRKLDKASDSWRSLRQRLHLECRECEVICERVVSPWHCLRSSCHFIYVYEEMGTTYFGCIHKIFSPELDMTAFLTACAERGRAADPYGHLRVACMPRPECAVKVERAYECLATPGCCCNPTFFLPIDGSSAEAIRLTANTLPPETDRGSQR